MLHQTSALPEVEDRNDRPVGVVLNCDRTRVAALTIDKVREWHDPFVAKPVCHVKADHSRQVALLRPELGRVRELPEQIRNDLVDCERSPPAPNLEVLLRDVVREDAGVVAEPVDGSGAACVTFPAK